MYFVSDKQIVIPVSYYEQRYNYDYVFPCLQGLGPYNYPNPATFY